MSPQKALETIGANLQKQYENWQPRVSVHVKRPPDRNAVEKILVHMEILCFSLYLIISGHTVTPASLQTEVVCLL